jgi:hypothetical protein
LDPTLALALVEAHEAIEEDAEGHPETKEDEGDPSKLPRSKWGKVLLDPSRWR